MIDPIVGGAIITGGAHLINGLISGFSGSSNTDKTNKMNYKIHQEDNAFNERMYHTSVSDQIAQWNRENAYNDPKAVRDRFLRAGINPAFALGDNGVGMSTSVNMPSAPSSSSAPQMQAAPPLDLHLGEAAESITRGLMVKETVKGQRIQNQKSELELRYREDELINNILEQKQRLQNMKDQDEHVKKQLAILDDELDILNNTRAERIRSYQISNQRSEKDLEEADSRIAINEAQKAAIDASTQLAKNADLRNEKELQARLANYAADTYQKYAAGKLSLQQAETEIKKRVVMEAERQGIVSRTNGQNILNAMNKSDYNVRKYQNAITQKGYEDLLDAHDKGDFNAKLTVGIMQVAETMVAPLRNIISIK